MEIDLLVLSFRFGSEDPTNLCRVHRSTEIKNFKVISPIRFGDLQAYVHVIYRGTYVHGLWQRALDVACCESTVMGSTSDGTIVLYSRRM